MEALTEILAHKLKFMEQHKDEEESEVFMDLLLKEKRKEAINEMVESRIIKSILAKRIEAPYKLE